MPTAFETVRIELGNLAEWVAAVGTVAAFMGGLYVISRDQGSRREQQALAAYDAALAVTVAVGQTGTTIPEGIPGAIVNTVITVPLVTVTNESSRTIYEVSADVKLPSGEQIDATTWEELPPHTWVPFESQPHDDMWSKRPGTYGLDLVATVMFKDSRGTYWIRDSGGAIRRPVQYVQGRSGRIHRFLHPFRSKRRLIRGDPTDPS